MKDVPGRKNLWDFPVFAQFRPEVDPFEDRHLFRPLSKAYNGDNTFWSTPSPEPQLDDFFWNRVQSHLDDDRIGESALRLAQSISEWEPDAEKLAFAAILRAGVPVADWLCRLLPGSVAASLSLFVGLGVDRVAVEAIRSAYSRKIVFVDGWTGRGGVAREIARLGIGPLAVLIDPWGWADFSGCREDIFCPTACFTGVATLGFSRTFYVDAQSLFAAYLFPDKYCRADVVRTWQKNCPPAGSKVSFRLEENSLARSTPFFKETDLRIHSNEVCRALINAAPDTLYFADDPAWVKAHHALLLELAERRAVKVVYRCRILDDYRTRVACSMKKS